MENINFLIAFFLVGIIFILFLFIITIFGYFFLFMINKRREKNVLKKPNLILEQFLISFGIGISVYISYGYILNIFNLFNFFTAYLNIIFFDIGFIIYYYIRNKRINLSKSYGLKIKAYFFNKKRILSVIIVSIILILSIFLYWEIITESTGLLSRDPYFWLENIYYLIENGSVTLKKLGYGYPSGFAIVTSGFVLIWQDYLAIYFFFKIASIFYLILYIIISFVILNHIFKSKGLVFFSLLLLHLSNYFLSRNILNISSSFASILVLISFILIVNDYPLYLQGFFISALFLINPLSFLLYLVILSAYILYKIFSRIRDRKLIYKELLSIFYLMIIAIIILIPYFINYPEDILDLFGWYEKIVNDIRFQNQFNFDSMDLENKFLLSVPFLDFFQIFRDQQFFIRFLNLTTHTIGLFFIATILGLFLSFPTKRKKLIIFSFSIIFILVCNFLPYFYSDLYFLDTFRYRSLELFALPIIIMATFFFECVIKLSKIIVNFLNSKLKTFNFKIHKEKLIINSILEFGFLLFLFMNVTSMISTRDSPDYYYYYNDDYVSITLYLRNNAESGSIISHPYLNRNDIHSILYDMDLYHYNLSSTPLLGEFFQNLRSKNTDYLIINNSEILELWENHISYNSYFRELIINLTYFSLYKVP